MAVGPDGAAVRRIVVAVVGRVANLLGGPGAPAVGGGQHDERRGCRIRALLLPAERRVADIDITEKGATRSVIRPDLLLVAESGRRLLAGDHWRHPGVGVAGRRRAA